jgi:hypothetical protein
MEETVVVVPGEILNVGSKATVIGLVIVVDEVILILAEVVRDPTNCKLPVPSEFPEPIIKVAPELIVVGPEKLLFPDRVSVPLVIVSPPVPLNTPLYVPDALDNVNVLEPKAVVPIPDSDLIDVPDVVVLISREPLFVKPLLVPILPLPVKASVDPELIVVAPVYVFAPDNCEVPDANVIPPAPDAVPLYVEVAPVKLSELLPSKVLPEPDKSFIDTTPEAELISNMPVLLTPMLEVIAPVPVIDKVEPVLIFVAPE